MDFGTVLTVWYYLFLAFFLYTIDDISILIIDSTKTDEALSCSKPDIHLRSGRRASGFLIEINYTDKIIHINHLRGHRCRIWCVIGFTTTYSISAYPLLSRGEVYSIQYYGIQFGSDIRQIGGFLWVIRFPPSIKLTTTM